MVFSGGALIAAGFTTTPPEGGFKLYLTGGVHPDRRGRGLGRRILRRHLDRAVQIHREFGRLDIDQPELAHVHPAGVGVPVGEQIPDELITVEGQQRQPWQPALPVALLELSAVGERRHVCGVHLGRRTAARSRRCASPAGVVAGGTTEVGATISNQYRTGTMPKRANSRAASRSPVGVRGTSATQSTPWCECIQALERVLLDLLHTFTEHAAYPDADSAFMTTERFYKIDRWGPPTLREASQRLQTSCSPYS
jgi:hypothetical protein